MRFEPSDLLEAYVCRCPRTYLGNRCQDRAAIIEFHHNQTDTLLRFSAALLQLCDIEQRRTVTNLVVRHQSLYRQAWPSTIRIFYEKRINPRLALMKVFQAGQDLPQLNVTYYLVYSRNQATISITMALTAANRCPNVSELLATNTSNGECRARVRRASIVMFLEIADNSLSLIYRYHSLCFDSPHRLCFYDDSYACMCNTEQHAECYRWYSSTIDTCRHCLADGYCVRGSLTDTSDFACICPRCHYGSICQHNTQLLSFTLESLLTADLLSPNRPARLFAACFFLLIPFIFFLAGLLNNLSAAMTFQRPKIAQIGVGHYLMWTCWLSQLSLLALIMKILHVIIGTQGLMHESLLVNRWMCKMITFGLSTTTRVTYWLTALVSVERVYITLFPTGIQLKKPKTAKVLIAIVLALTIVSHVHEVVFYNIVQDPKYSQHGKDWQVHVPSSWYSPYDFVLVGTWCAAQYSSIFGRFDRANVLIHHLAPSIIHLSCTLLLIAMIARRRAHVTGADGARLFREQIFKRKDLFIPSCFIIISGLPQFIISFLFACTELKLAWQRYALITAYLVTFTRQMLTFFLYIQPSSMFKEEFYMTSIGQRFQSMSHSA